MSLNEMKLENIVVACLGSESLMKPLIFWNTSRVPEYGESTFKGRQPNGWAGRPLRSQIIERGKL